MFFEDMFGGGGGGFHGGFGGMPTKPKGDTTKLYKVLGVDTKATTSEIKKAYRSLARKYHPDRPSGDAEKFKEVQNAYDVLGDANRKIAYDATGDPDADERIVARHRKPKGKTTKFELSVPLEQFYNAHTRRIRVTKSVVCTTCNGEGGSGVTSCGTCRGRGIRVIDRQIGPGMIQRMQVQCNACDGKGQVIPPGKRCKDCKTVGTTKTSSVLSVHVEKGMKHGEKIVFNEEGDQSLETTPGDVVVILKQASHPVFTRTPDGCHLVVEKKITLVEALTGFAFNLEHLDGRILHIQSRPGHVYTTGTVDALREEGMPLRGDVMTRGHLYIKLQVIYPTTLSANQKAKLKNILGPAPSPAAPMVDEEKLETVSLESVDIQAEKAAYAKLIGDHRSQYDEDEDEMGGPQEVGCRTA